MPETTLSHEKQLEMQYYIKCTYSNPEKESEADNYLDDCFNFTLEFCFTNILTELYIGFSLP